MRAITERIITYPTEADIVTLFEKAEVVSEYSDRMALEDGIIFDVQELSRLSPSIKWSEGPFQYVTTNLCYQKGNLKDGVDVQLANFLDLFRNVSEHMKRTGPDHFYSLTTEFPEGTRGEVYAVKNNNDRSTLMLPDDY